MYCKTLVVKDRLISGQAEFSYCLIETLKISFIQAWKFLIWKVVLV